MTTSDLSQAAQELGELNLSQKRSPLQKVEDEILERILAGFEEVGKVEDVHREVRWMLVYGEEMDLDGFEDGSAEESSQSSSASSRPPSTPPNLTEDAEPDKDQDDHHER